MDKQTQKELLNIVKRNYDEIADKYNETRKKRLEPLWSEIVRYAKDAKSGSKVLDVGCGNGRLIEAFGEIKINYLGIDINEKLLEYARTQKPGFDFRTGNILELGQIPETDFDYVFSIAVLHHLPGHDLRIQALKQLKNKVKPDGRIILTAWNMNGRSWKKKKFTKKIWKFFFLKLIGKNKMDFGDLLIDWKSSNSISVSKRYYHAFRKYELKKLAKEAGLSIEKSFKDDYNYYLVLKK
jgi:2-polyprenyl-3-methyl-5-hydroxy-6-metoxy-1,4-benzoquinol methylase